MKTLYDYDIQPGRCSLKYYKFFIVGIGTLKNKTKILEALNLGMKVFRYDKIMGNTDFWNGEKWEAIKNAE